LLSWSRQEEPLPTRTSTLSVTLAIGALAVAVAGGCGADPQPAPVAVAHADGERGVGRFNTMWGVQELHYVWAGGKMVHDGDIVFEPEDEIPRGAVGSASQALLKQGAAWTLANGVVRIPYYFDPVPGVPGVATTESRIRQAVAEWTAKVRAPSGAAIFNFVEIPMSQAAQEAAANGVLRFNLCDGCQGRGVCYTAGNPNGGTMRIDADYRCPWEVLTHEVGHALSYKHEQRRADRDSAIIYYPGRTNEDGQFDLINAGNYLGTTYDVGSIMHYSSCTFSTANTCNANTPGAWVVEKVQEE
jgi:hypothetical protein